MPDFYSHLYLYLDLFTLAGPFLLSFDKKVAYFRSWKYLFPAIAVMASIFIPWDIAFTKYGVWGFNDPYLVGVYFFGLPIEEVLFFIVVPYACVFIYACLQAYVAKDVLKSIHRPVLFVLAILLLLIGFIYFNRLYTSITFISTGLYLIYHLYKKSVWLSRFLLAYIITLIPFLIVNGMLTGMATSAPVVYYNSAHILNLRIGTIPVEDSMYNMLMFLITLHVFEYLKNRKKING
jgi:lycopene cyclase domain-containing protein